MLALLRLSANQAQHTFCDRDSFCTFWHDGEINTKTPVANHRVRQSRRYLVQVGGATSNDSFDSFVYEAIPRNGNGRIFSPLDSPNTDTLPSDVDDGVPRKNEGPEVSMSWTSFEHRVDVDVKILRRDGTLISPSDVIIRPVAHTYSVNGTRDGGIVIRVPVIFQQDTKAQQPRQFSVEFGDDLHTWHSDGKQYTTAGAVVSVEPVNALLVFASPFLPPSLVPSINDTNVHVMEPGPMNSSSWGTAPVLYFPPGVYWMSEVGRSHMKLSTSTHWVHLAAGAYVKAAVEYSTTDATTFLATGHGVLSGENYVYQANPLLNYTAVKSDASSLRMWGHSGVAQGQRWKCVGPTVTAPPFNSMDFRGACSKVSVAVADYKQVGAFFYQTDGPEMYPGSTVSDVFYHVNDDAIKTYYSNVSLRGVTVWKVRNDPVIQMGWSSREVHAVVINGLHVIHSRYVNTGGDVVPSAIIGASRFYGPGGKLRPDQQIEISISNVTCEGPCPALMHVVPLQSYRIRISNVAFPDGLQKNSIGIGRSQIPKSSGCKMDLLIQNWTVGSKQVNMSNFQSDSLGQFNIDVAYWGQWEIK